MTALTSAAFTAKSPRKPIWEREDVEMEKTMTRLDRLKAIARKLEWTTAGSEWVDQAFWCVQSGYDKITVDQDPFPRFYAVKAGSCEEISEREIVPITKSTEVVLPLLATHVPGLVEVSFSFEPDEPAIWPAATVRWYPRGKSGPDWHAEVATGATLPIALCATLLKVMIHEEEMQISAESAAL